MDIVKRTGIPETYDGEKIIRAMEKAFAGTGNIQDREVLERLLSAVEEKLAGTEEKTVENIQDFVEETLMRYGFFTEAKNYILFRQKRSEQRRNTY